MQPQTPQASNGSPLPPDNNPTPPPAPSAQPQLSGQPSPSPVVAPSFPTQPTAPPPQPQPLMTSSTYKQGRNFSKKIILASIIAGALLLAGGGVFAFAKFTGGVKLVKYSDKNFEILYPKDYETKKSKVDGGVEFTEPGSEEAKKGDENHNAVKKDDQSGIIVVTREIGNASEDDKKRFFDKFEENVKEEEKISGDDDEIVIDKNERDEEIVINKNERTKHNGNDAIKITGTYKVNGKKAGTIKAVGALTKDKLYMVMVAAHISDPGVEKKADAIIDSIKLK